MALSTTGYGQIPFDEEMQKPSYRPPSSFDDCIGDSAQLLRSFKKTKRLASLDAFRGLCVFLMMVVDYGGSVFPIIAHSPWNGLHLADFVMPFFLFVVGVSIALVYKKAPNKTEATWKAAGRAVKLFLLGILLQGGFLHGLNSLTYGVDMEKIRLLGILQVNCSVRGNVGPACNSAGMIDRYVLGINHLYAKPVYKNLKECKMSRDKSVPDDAPSWCHAPFDPEGLISSITAAVTCLIGLQFGHVLAHLQDHKGRLENWCGFSVFLLVLGLFLALIG
ncbi:Heparan-alpha-glucosaminide N-acetyltransferase [Linum perenne]